MIRISPALRISVGLVFITISILLLGNFIGLIPDQSLVDMKVRKSLAESLAAQCTLAAQDNRVGAIKKTMDVIVEMEAEILSLGMRNTEGRYLTQTKDHNIHWITPAGDGSSSTHWQVPIYQGTKLWATLEISFTPQGLLVLLDYQVGQFNLLLGFFALISFAGFSIFMKRTLRHLDPSNVMPSRVKYAFDSLCEGIILLDKNERIILVNSSFAEKLECDAKDLMGLKASKLGWINPRTSKAYYNLPWTQAISQSVNKSGIQINISTKSHGVLAFVANISQILDDKGKSRGALVTFDDVTELEQKNAELIETIEQLHQSNYKVELQNQELAILATHDPLTNCLNRRDFFQRAKKYFTSAIQEEQNIACIMADIDKFKSINDQYGHAVGDKVIQHVASILQSAVRADEEVCRYGGEEFCILLPNCDIENASAIAERVRSRISAESARKIPDTPGLNITVSFGVSDITLGAPEIYALIAQADRALYMAKNSGRDLVISWDIDKENECKQNSDSRKQILPFDVQSAEGISEPE